MGVRLLLSFMILWVYGHIIRGYEFVFFEFQGIFKCVKRLKFELPKGGGRLSKEEKSSIMSFFVCEVPKPRLFLIG